MPDGTEGSGSPFVITGVLTEPDNRKSGHYVAAECAVPVSYTHLRAHETD